MMVDRETEKSDNEKRYLNPALENYVAEGQMDIFDYLGKPDEQKKSVPFELCMNPPIED